MAQSVSFADFTPQELEHMEIFDRWAEIAPLTYEEYVLSDLRDKEFALLGEVIERETIVHSKKDYKNKKSLYNRRYYRKNAEKIKAQRRIGQTDKTLKEAERAYRKRNRDKLKAYSRLYRETNEKSNNHPLSQWLRGDKSQ